MDFFRLQSFPHFGKRRKAIETGLITHHILYHCDNNSSRLEFSPRHRSRYRTGRTLVIITIFLLYFTSIHMHSSLYADMSCTCFITRISSINNSTEFRLLWVWGEHSCFSVEQAWRASLDCEGRALCLYSQSHFVLVWLQFVWDSPTIKYSRARSLRHFSVE